MRVKNLINKVPHSGTEYNRKLEKIEKVIIHHTTDPIKWPLLKAAHSIADYHVNSLGWSVPGYHLLIDKKGQIGQLNKLDVISPHTRGENTTSVGVAVNGCFHPSCEKESEPLEKQLESLNYAISFIQDKLKDKKVPNKGHRDYNATSCPGDNLYPKIKDIQVIDISDDVEDYEDEITGDIKDADLTEREPEYIKTYRRLYQEWYDLLEHLFNILQKADEKNVSKLMSNFFGREWVRFYDKRKTPEKSDKEVALELYKRDLNIVRPHLEEE